MYGFLCMKNCHKVFFPEKDHLTAQVVWKKFHLAAQVVWEKDHLTAQVNIYTGNELKVGHSANAETGATVTVQDKNHPGAPAWIDNPGALRTSSRR